MNEKKNENEVDRYGNIEEDSESVSMDTVKVPLIKSKYEHISEFLNKPEVLLTFITGILYILAYFLKDYYLNTENLFSNEKNMISAGSLLFTFSTGVLFTKLGEFIIYNLTLKFLKKTAGTGSFFFYTNELAFHIAFSMYILIIIIYNYCNSIGFYIITPFGLKMTNYNTCLFLLLLVISLGSVKAIERYISSGFNYNLYIERIRKILFREIFVSLPIIQDKYENKKGENTKESLFGLNFIFNDRYCAKDVSNISNSAKRILLKEFKHRAFETYKMGETLPAAFKKIATKACSHSKNMMKAVHMTNLYTLGDYALFFPSKSAFNFFLRELQLDKSYIYENETLQIIYEKLQKEKFTLFKTLFQLERALLRISFAVKLLISLGVMIIAYLKASDQIGMAAGIISGFFGTTFISKIWSDSVIQSIIFLFVIHPYDIGDRVFIRLNGEVENLIVAELNVFSTVFIKWDGTSFFVPNNILINVPISNIKRSQNIMETHSIQVSFNTSPNDLDYLKNELHGFVRKNEYDYVDYILVNYDRIVDSHKLYIKVLMQYKGSWQNYDAYLRKRSAFITELNRILKAGKITYNLPVQKVLIQKSAKTKK